MATPERDPLDRFDAYLDGWAETARTHPRAEPPASDHDRVLFETVQRLRALDAADAPDPALAARIWQELMNRRGLVGTMQVAANGTAPALNGRAAPRPWRAYLPALPVAKKHRRWGMAIPVTALLVLAALFALYFAFRPTDEKARQPVVGTPTAIPAPTVPGDPVVFRWAVTGDGQNRLQHPLAAAFDPSGRLWVLDAGSGRFFVFDADGNLLETWGEAGSGDGQFSFCCDAGAFAFAPDGGFYVADMGNARVQQFDRDRHFVRSWGTKGTGNGQFEFPDGVAVLDSGDVLVADALRNDIQRFGPDGTYLGPFGAGAFVPGPFTDPWASEGLGFLAVAPDGNVWVPELVKNRILVFDPTGTLLFSLDQPDTDSGLFDQPAQVAFDDAGHIFVADQGDNLIRVFDAQRRFLYRFGGSGTGDGEFNGAEYPVVDGESIYVVDWHGNRLEKFAIVGPFPPPAPATPVVAATPSASP